MWKKLILLVPIFLNISCATATFVESKHIRDLRSEFPIGLLTDDYGLLTRDDLTINDCNATAVLFSENSTSYSYWQCFKSENSKLFCEGSGYDEEEKTQLTMMVLSGILNGDLHEYITTRAIPLAACKEFVKDWNRLLQGERHVCISGSFTHRTQEPSGRWKWLWTFDRFKTRKGCEPYFFGGCSLRYQIEHGCKIKLNPASSVKPKF